jgi:hypothetical protein
VSLHCYANVISIIMYYHDLQTLVFYCFFSLHYNQPLTKGLFDQMVKWPPVRVPCLSRCLCCSRVLSFKNTQTQTFKNIIYKLIVLLAYSNIKSFISGAAQKLWSFFDDQ